MSTKEEKFTRHQTTEEKSESTKRNAEIKGNKHPESTKKSAGSKSGQERSDFTKKGSQQHHWGEQK